MCRVENVHPLWKQISTNTELISFENEGFERGEKKGKTMNVSSTKITESVVKQFSDFCEAYSQYRIAEKDKDIKLEKLKKSIGDIRNVCGCLFLKLNEENKSE